MEEAPEIEELEAQEPPPSPASGSSPTHATAAAGFRLTGNKRGRAAASSEAMQGLREVAAPMNGSDCCCAICFHDMDAGDVKLRAMPCSHVFHQDCIFKWLRRSAACPLCRHQLPTEAAAAAEEEEVQQQQVRRIWILGEELDHWHNLVDQQLERIRFESERLDHQIMKQHL
ncbi:hypothetical protein HU200_008052 [Digitaria exilis]|uniref:RING-type domain-containing protein n=1 Tax=Digitaria exilis TaxID=1010633 RepID=A0A835KQH6_9POAL|nr:hypothetical protein HU200_008052 [Digitaria exilis]